MRGGDLLLGAGDPRGHGGLRHQERAGHLGRGQPAHQPQGEGDLSLARQGLVAAGEDQPQPVVVTQAVLGSGYRLFGNDQRQPAAEHRLAAQHIQGPMPRDAGQPGTRPVGDPGLRPGLRGLRVRVLGALLGEIEVPGQLGGAGQHPGPLAAVRLCDRRDDLLTHP